MSSKMTYPPGRGAGDILADIGHGRMLVMTTVDVQDVDPGKHPADIDTATGQEASPGPQVVSRQPVTQPDVNLFQF